MTRPLGSWGIFGGCLIMAWGDLQGFPLWQLYACDLLAAQGGVL